MTGLVFVLYIGVASKSLVGYDWRFLTEVGEFQTMVDCQQAAEAATYKFGDNPKWKPFNDGAMCVPRQKAR